MSRERIESEVPHNVTGVARKGNNAEQVKDIEVVVEETEVYLDHTCDPNGGSYYEQEYDSIAGGQSLEKGTSCTPAYDPSVGKYVFISSGHTHIAESYTHQPDESYDHRVGDVSEATNTGLLDYSVSELNHTDRTATWVISDQYSLVSEGIGELSWEAIKDLEDSRDPEMYRQGKKTGRCYGSVVKCSKSDSVRYFTTTASRKGGDSGGPHFKLNDSSAAMVGGVHRGYNSRDNATAPFLGDILQEAGLELFP